MLNLGRSFHQKLAAGHGRSADDRRHLRPLRRRRRPPAAHLQLGEALQGDLTCYRVLPSFVSSGGAWPDSMRIDYVPPSVRKVSSFFFSDERGRQRNGTGVVRLSAGSSGRTGEVGVSHLGTEVRTIIDPFPSLLVRVFESTRKIQGHLVVFFSEGFGSDQSRSSFSVPTSRLSSCGSVLQDGRNQ